jgi:hypothetical protein
MASTRPPKIGHNFRLLPRSRNGFRMKSTNIHILPFLNPQIFDHFLSLDFFLCVNGETLVLICWEKGNVSKNRICNGQKRKWQKIISRNV